MNTRITIFHCGILYIYGCLYVCTGMYVFLYVISLSAIMLFCNVLSFACLSVCLFFVSVCSPSRLYVRLSVRVSCCTCLLRQSFLVYVSVFLYVSFCIHISYCIYSTVKQYVFLSSSNPNLCIYADVCLSRKFSFHQPMFILLPNCSKLRYPSTHAPFFLTTSVRLCHPKPTYTLIHRYMIDRRNMGTYRTDRQNRMSVLSVTLYVCISVYMYFILYEEIYACIACTLSLQTSFFCTSQYFITNVYLSYCKYMCVLGDSFSTHVYLYVFHSICRCVNISLL